MSEVKDARKQAKQSNSTVKAGAVMVTDTAVIYKRDVLQLPAKAELHSTTEMHGTKRATSSHTFYRIAITSDNGQVMIAKLGWPAANLTNAAKIVATINARSEQMRKG